MRATIACSRSRHSCSSRALGPFSAHARLLRTSRPAEIGPLIAGIGIAAVLYGTKMLLDVANNPEVQDTVRRAAASASDAAGQAAARAKDAAGQMQRGTRSGTDAASASTATSPNMRTAESYFTTDVMGVDLGHGAKEWSGACVAVVAGGVLRVVENEQGSRTTPGAVAFSDSGDVLVGQPAKNLLYSRSARSVVGHQLLLGMQYDSPEATALRTPDTALRTPATRPPGAVPGAVSGVLALELAKDSSTGMALIQVHGVGHKPEELSGRVLSGDH